MKFTDLCYNRPMRGLSNLFSTLFGYLAHIKLPPPLGRFSIDRFAGLYGIDPAMATQPLTSFRSIGEFFIRDIDPQFRPLGEGIVSPVDGTVRSAGPIESATIFQAKGAELSVGRLLSDDVRAKLFEGGYYWNFYLSPRDAHHIVAPFGGEIVLTKHIPGKLFPVQEWAVRRIKNLFCVNERIVTFIQSGELDIAIVMIGALNVGKIRLAYHPLETNQRKQGALTYEHMPPIAIEKGRKLGSFLMGSSVVILVSHCDNPRLLEPGTTVSFGQSLEGG